MDFLDISGRNRTHYRGKTLWAEVATIAAFAFFGIACPLENGEWNGRRSKNNWSVSIKIADFV